MMGLEEIKKANADPARFYNRGVTDGQGLSRKRNADEGNSPRQDETSIERLHRGQGKTGRSSNAPR